MRFFPSIQDTCSFQGCLVFKFHANNVLFSSERGIRVVREAWLLDSIEKQEAQPLEAYDIVTDLTVEGKGIPWDKQDPFEEALESLAAEVRISF